MGVRGFSRVASSLVLAAMLAACGGSSSVLTLEALDEVSGVRVTADNATKNDVVTSGGAITVVEGDVLVISPDFPSGGVHLNIRSQDGPTVAYSGDVGGRQMSTADVEPGTYDVEITGDGATGTMLVFAEPQSTMDAQNEGLRDRLESAEVAELNEVLSE